MGVKFKNLLKSSETKCACFYSKRNLILGYLFVSKTDPNLLVRLVELANFRGNRHKKHRRIGFPRFTGSYLFVVSIPGMFYILGRYRLLHNLDIQIPQGVSGIEIFGFKYLLNCSDV